VELDTGREPDDDSRADEPNPTQEAIGDGEDVPVDVTWSGEDRAETGEDDSA
jgi:hypothetical protein